MFDAMKVLDWEAVCSAALSGLGHALLLGSVLAVLTWIVVRVLHKRISPGLEMALWCVVLLRFVIPGGPGWSGSLASLCTAVVPAQTHAGAELEALPTPAMPGDAATGDATTPVMTATAFPPGWATLSVAVYAAGLIALGVVRAVSYRRFRAACLALPEADAETQRVVRAVCVRVGMRRMPRVRVSEDERAPFVMGVLGPVLVLSRRQLVRPDELETVIVHEVTHLRRGDMLVRCVQCVAGLVFFFWPVVAWVNRRIDRAREYACDEWALRCGRLSPGQYARCLFEVTRWRRLSRWTYAPACMAGHPSTLERRIDVILTQTARAPRGVLGRLGAAVLLVAWCGFSLTGAQEKTPGATAKYAATEAGMRQHADVLFAHVKELPGGDINGDGQVTKEECWAFVTAVILSQPDAVLAEYPGADRNGNKQLEVPEAFFFGRGDYDFEDLHEKLGPEKKLLGEGQDEQKVQEFKQQMATAEYATWHVILDRRAQLIDSAKKLPSPEFVRKVFNNDMKELLATGEFEQCVQGVKEVAKLKQEAKKLRDKAAGASDAHKAKLEAKAGDFEQKAAQLTSKLQSEIAARVEAADANGATEDATRYRGLLKKLESL